MENNKSNNKLVTILLIIIVCLILGGGYTIYTLLSNDSNNNISNANEENNDLNKEYLTDIITVERIETEEYYYLVYTKKDKNNNVIWTYETSKGNYAQYETSATIKNLENELHIYTDETLVVLDKTTGKVLSTKKVGHPSEVFPGY